VELRLEQPYQPHQLQADPDELKLWDETGMMNDGGGGGGSVSTDTLSIKPRRRRRRSKKRNEDDKSKQTRREQRKDKKEKSKQNNNAAPTTPERSSPFSKSPLGTPDTVIIEEEEEYKYDDGDWFGESEYYASIEVIQKLKNKDIKDIIIYADDYDTSTFQLLIENLLENTGLTAVKVYRLQDHETARRIRSTPEMARLFSAIRALRNLEKLDLSNMEETELEMITSIVKRHPTLTHFRLHFTHGGVDTDFLQAMVGAPLLGDISLEIQKSFPISILFESKTLTKLSVWSHQFKFQDDHFVAAMQTLEHNDTLLTLDLKPRISSLGMRALSFAVDENKGLTTLKFSYKDNPQTTGKMLLHLVHALTRNSKLRVLTNYSGSQIKVSSADETRMMELLESNTVMEQLEIFDDDDCVSFKERLLRDNKDRNINGKGFLSEWFSNKCGTLFLCGDDCGEDFEGGI
jgi:hypothetical protein